MSLPKLEPVANQEMIKVEPTSSNEQVKLSYEGVKAEVYEDCSNQAPSSSTSVSNSEGGTAEPAQELVPCEKGCSNEFGLEQKEKKLQPFEETPLKCASNETQFSLHTQQTPENSFHSIESEFSSGETSVSNVLSNKMRIFQCEICKNMLTEKTVFNGHSCIHPGHKCESYKKNLNDTRNLNGHKVAYTVENPYECEICMKKFYIKAHLDRHIRIHTGEKPYECEICMRKFSCKGNLRSHRRVHTGEKPYECEICMKKYSQRGGLRTHLRVHTREKPHECEICMKKFSHKNGLNLHRHIHTREKLYICEICMKTFKHKPSFDKHRRIHTGEKP